jgi:hypothetical protein
MTLDSDRKIGPRNGLKLTPQQRDELLRRYVAGENTKILIDQFGVGHPAICNMAKRRGVKTRGQKRLPLNDDAFAFITPESAYWIGFMMADGAIWGKRVSIMLSDKDSEHMQKFKKFLSSGLKMIYAAPRVLVGKYISRPQIGVGVYSIKMVSDLAKYGVVPNKSKTAKVIGLEINRDFWRGVIDGDGCIDAVGIYPRISLTGSYDLVSQFSNFIQHCIGFSPNIIRDKGVYRAQTAGHRAISVIRVLYENATVSLDRKAEKARQVLEHTPSLPIG